MLNWIISMQDVPFRFYRQTWEISSWCRFWEVYSDNLNCYNNFLLVLALSTGMMEAEHLCISAFSTPMKL